MQLLSWRRSLRIHIHHEARVLSEGCHRTLCITTVGTTRIGLDEFPDGKAIRSFFSRDGQMFAHAMLLCCCSIGLVTLEWRESRETPRSRIDHIHDPRLSI